MRLAKDDVCPSVATGVSLIRRSILVAAYACNPRHGSEEAVGWEWVQAIACDHDVTVLTAAFHQRDIEAVTAGEANPRFIYVPHRWWHYWPSPRWKRIEQSVFKPIMNLAYAQWQRDAARVARELLSKDRFDLIHQVTYVGYRFPGRLWTLGLPFVWGPIGGLENTPWRLLPAMGSRGAIYYAGRNIINSAQRQWLRSPRRALREAGPGVIAATGSIERALKAVYGVDSTVVAEVVAPVSLSPASPKARSAGEPLRLVWSGLHLPGKALNLVLMGLARLPPGVNWSLDILGDGPCRADWQKLADGLSLSERCHWHGRLSRHEALDKMSHAHVLVISSLKDLTSTVLLEGIALGLPVICPDHCGFSDVVTESCGIKVPPTNIQAVVTGLAKAVQDLGCDEPRRYRMGQAALERAKEYTWETKRLMLNEVYQRVLVSDGTCSTAD